MLAPSRSLTIQRVLAYLVPSGTGSFSLPPDWAACPLWAPDVFAVAATLLEKSGSYAEPGVAFSSSSRERFRKVFWARHIDRYGDKWANKLPPPSVVQQLWGIIIRRRGMSVCDNTSGARIWKQAALRLLALADRASVGLGWIPGPDDSEAAATLFKQYIASAVSTPVLQLPYSIAWLVQSDCACVQPKANTPQVGCTLRSLSHNLALLPGRGEVQTEWHISALARSDGYTEPTGERPFNILLIPFPYVVHGTAFHVTRPPPAGLDGYFSIEQQWLHNGAKKISGKLIAEFVVDLIRKAKEESGCVDCIVFPEASLTPQIAKDIANIVAISEPCVELVVAGTLQAKGSTFSNEALLLTLSSGKIIASRSQRKHHRWKLDKSQIKNYNLGASLVPRFNYWEDIELHERKLHFGVFRNESVITALVCEDLARADPVMPVLAAIGPNLVIALLMDGPQLIGRWSGRYATVLADDPGAAILTVTSLGMVQRSRVPGQPLPGSTGRRCIALWREPGGDAHELDMPANAHGLVLTLSTSYGHQRTLDMRDDNGASACFSLSSVRAVTAATTPSWLEAG